MKKWNYFFKDTNLMSKKIIKFVSIFWVFVMVISNSAIANAAPAKGKVVDTQNSLAEENSLLDVLDVHGKPVYNQNKAQISQNVNGMFSLLIDLKQYRAAHPELYAAYGDNWKAYLDHYLTRGFNEKLNSFGYFDARAYADRYPDLKAAFGYDVISLYRHYIMYGLLEGRNGGANGVRPIVFDAKAYADRYPDLKAAFGYNETELYKHFIMYGVAEGRNSGRNTLKTVYNTSSEISTDSTEINNTKPDDSGSGSEDTNPDINVPGSGDTEPDDTGEYTRAEWIHLLMEQCNLSYYNSDMQTNYYADTKGHQYEKEIEAAKSHNIIPVLEGQDDQDVPVFHPDDLADREFAAVTSVLALRYSGDGSGLECIDSADLQFPKEAKIAVTVGLIKLEDNAFYPGRALTTIEKDSILEKIADLCSIQGNEEPISNMQYADDVVVLAGQTQFSDYAVSDDGSGRYVITVIDCAQTRAIESGKCFVLPANGQHPSGMALKAVSITPSDGKLTIVAEKPVEIAEVITHLEYEGQAEAVLGQAEALIEGVDVAYDPNGSVDEVAVLSSRAAIGGSFEIPGKWTFNFGEGKKIGNNAELSGKVEISIPDVTAYLNMDFELFSDVTVNELTFSVTEKAKFNGKIEYTVTEAVDGSIEFARIPFALGTTGLSIDLVFSLYYDIKGNISINYTIMATEGVQYVDNNFRFIGNFDSQLDIAKIEGSGQIGVKPAINLVFFEIWDIIGVDGKIGASGTVSLTEHTNPSMTCIDGTVYLAASCGLNQDTIIGEFVKEKWHYTLEKEFYDSDNSPVKLKLHFEDGERVDECTYGDGGIKGFVYDAASRAPLKYARVSVYCGDSLKAVAYTNDEGAYEIPSGLPTNEYVDIKISATGYKTYTDTRMLNRNAPTYIEAYMLVGRSEEEFGAVAGSLIDAITGDGIRGASIEVREGWGNTTGGFILSETLEAADYSLTLPAGNYTVLAKHDDYLENSINITVVAQTESQNSNISLYPHGTEAGDINQLKIVLTWGENPRDIDSHLFGPDVDGTGIFHTYYSNKNYYGGNEPIAELDRDDIDSYGPETTTVYKMNSEGKYSFYVHDYTNRYSTDSSEMSLSDAKVVVYNGDEWLATYNVPMHTGGTVWHVFDYDAATSSLTPSNAMYFNSDPDDLGMSAYSTFDSGELTEDMAVRIISETSRSEKDSDNIDSEDVFADEKKMEDEEKTELDDTGSETELGNTVEGEDKTKLDVSTEDESNVDGVAAVEGETGSGTNNDIDSEDIEQ